VRDFSFLRGWADENTRGILSTLQQLVLPALIGANAGDGAPGRASGGERLLA
jgi:hypothetical protein